MRDHFIKRVVVVVVAVKLKLFAALSKGVGVEKTLESTVPCYMCMCTSGVYSSSGERRRRTRVP